MARKRAKKNVKKKQVEVKPSNDMCSICPMCGKQVETHRCADCGCTKTINAVSGNVMWMKNGRLIVAFHNEKQAYINIAEKYNIPKNKYPKKYLED